MSNFRILVDNIVDSSTITASYTGGGSTVISADNLKKYGNSKIFRAETENTYSIVQLICSFPAETYVDLIALVRHNLGTDDTWSFYLYDGPFGEGDVVYSSEDYRGDGFASLFAGYVKSLDELDWGVDPLNTTSSYWDVKNNTSYVVIPKTLARSIKIVLSKYEVGFLDVTRLYIGPSILTSINVDYGMSNSWVDNSSQERVMGGGMWCNYVEKYRKASFSLSNMNSGDRSKLYEAYNKMGKTKDFFIAMFPNVGGMLDRDHAFPAKFTNNPDFSNTSFDNYATQLEIEEV